MIDRLAKKEGESYAQTDCILMIDITNLMYTVASDLAQETLNQLTKAVEKYSTEDKYGAIILYLYAGSQKGQPATYHSNLVKSLKINPKLNSFIEQYYSHNGHTVEGPIIPKEG